MALRAALGMKGTRTRVGLLPLCGVRSQPVQSRNLPHVELAGDGVKRNERGAISPFYPNLR